MRNEMFDLYHTTYIIVSLILTVIITVLVKKKMSGEGTDRTLKIFGWATFLLHISSMWVEYLVKGEAEADQSILFPIYYCNLAMYLLLITSIYSKKDSKVIKYLSVVTAYAGIIGSLVSLIYPEYYLSSDVLDYHIVKSMLSHSTMLVASLILLTNNYFEIKLKNTLVYTIGILGFGLVGLVINTTFSILKLEAVNAMYLQAPPVEEAPFLNVYVISLLTVIFVFIVSSMPKINSLLKPYIAKRKKSSVWRLFFLFI